MKRTTAFVLSVIMMLGACFFLPTADVLAADDTVDSGIDYTESTERLSNPNMGYPSHASISLNDSFSARNDSGFTWYYVNISAYSGSNSMLPDGVTWPAGRVDRPISDKALEAFRGTLENLRQNGGSCFIRFVYDWDGQTGREPSDIETIIQHIEQLCGVVSDFSDICFGFECGIIGVFGEMHSSIYCGSQYANRIIDAYLDNTPDTMILMVRTPTYITQYLGVSRSELAELVTEKGSPEYRLSYFNDGYMNSNNDLGTWYDREQDIKFLSRQAAHGAYGGEFGSAYWILPCTACLPENAIPEMYTTHLNFIRGNVYSTKQNSYFGYDSYEYGPEYEEDWYPDNSAFYGVDCHQFIVAHLGYRLVVRESRLSKETVAGGTLTLKGKIENTGFGNVIHRPTTQILLVGDGYTYVCDTAIEAETFQSCTVQDYAVTLSLPESMPEGEYKVYMRMTASTQTDFLSVRSAIQFANAGGIFNAELGGNLIGTVNVSAADTADVSAANDVFCEIGEGAVSDGRVTAGAPLINGYGMPAADGTIDMNYHQGDTLSLSAWNMVRSDANVTYKWYKDSVQIGSEATLTVEELSPEDAGEYSLTVIVGVKSVSTMTVNVTVDEHKYGDYTTVESASCHTVGSEMRSCAHCSDTETRIVPTTAHKAGTPKKVLSTCTVRGSITVSCTKCSDVLEYEILDLEPHDCETIIEEPSCLREGKKTLKCIDCDYRVSETISALGHDYVYAVDGNKAEGVCSRCMDSTGELTFDGYDGGYADAEDFDNGLGPVSVDESPLTLIGEDGYLTEYTADGDGFITFLFRIEGAEEQIKLGKFRITAYAADDLKNLGDSNNAGNYYGDLLFTVDGDGVYAFTLRKYLMLPYGNSGWGLITHAAFNDPDMTEKGKDTVNPNKDATLELLGVYDGCVDYHLLFMDSEGNFLESHEGTYNPNITWSNKLCSVPAASELYTGDVPVKRATCDTVYTFSHWADAEGNEIDLAVGSHILYPVFTESENTCAHDNTEDGVIVAPTCTEKGKGAKVCADCGAPVGSEYDIEATGHLSETVSVKTAATFKVTGKADVYCTDCRAFLRTEVIPKVVNPFKDVNINAWYSDAVAYAYTNSIFGGISATAFAPNANMTRAMFVTVLGRMSGVPEDKNAETAFTDVKRGQYYTGYVAWANKNGIVNGRSETSFAPDALITREEMCVMLVRYCEYELISLGNDPVVDSFADATKFSKWSINQIETCRRAGIIGGKAVNANGDALFQPKGNATRAEVATILYNLKSKYID